MTEPAGVQNVIQISSAFWLSRCLHVVASLGIADALDETPASAARLAQSVGANPDAVGRLLRLLAAHGVFEMRDGEFTHTAASRLLREDHPYSLRPLVRMMGLSVFWNSYEKLEHTARTGRPASEKVAPKGMFQYLADHPAENGIFNSAMAAKARGQIAAVVKAYDFSNVGTIGDIGGGRGHLILAVLDAAPQAKGVLFDLPQVIDALDDLASDRLTVQKGDFFTDDLPGCDVYILMDVIHDWNDETARAILGSVRRAALPAARLLIIESLLPETTGPHFVKSLDVNMLTLTGGRQRTRAEYELLGSASGFRLERVIDTPVVSILESRPA